ncbi:hypothetical protein D5H75_06530 [Bailinhaonella thermotolerans]|uniref:Lipoprotein n=1 Tax=Bailinhaonella thermotolerans TaxID=1070861 RepID=A0A3A4B8T0_9ACTN|nr:hypothetical protein D5H75_06530 [Bailinhaonella thermotolerans]
MPRRRAVVVKLLLLGPAAAALALTGCGSPEYTYVRNADTYFKVPASWHQVDGDQLDLLMSGEDPASASAEARKRLVWDVAFDAHRDPSPAHLFMGLGDEPFVYASVHRLTEEQRDALSLDAMRDFILPVTEGTREKAARAGFPLSGYEPLRDEVLHPGEGLRGVRVVFNYRLAGGPLHTFDQTAYMSADLSRVHVMLIRCSAGCYRARADEFDAIARSFRVKQASG